MLDLEKKETIGTAIRRFLDRPVGPFPLGEWLLILGVGWGVIIAIVLFAMAMVTYPAFAALVGALAVFAALSFAATLIGMVVVSAWVSSRGG